MGISVNGQICYGVILKEGQEFPWDKEGYGIETWWVYSILGFRHSVELYDKNGNLLEGINPSQEEIDTYWQEKYDFQKQNPAPPVKLINYGFGYQPLWMLAVPSSVRAAPKCNLTIFKPSYLTVTEHEQNNLIRFCRQYGIVFYEGPRWWLSSYRD